MSKGCIAKIYYIAYIQKLTMGKRNNREKGKRSKWNLVSKLSLFRNKFDRMIK